MRRPRLPVFIFSLVIASLASVVVNPSFAAQSAPQAASASLTGRVLDPTGAVVPGALVTVESANGSRHTVTTDPAGVYSLPVLDPGRYTLTVSLPAFRVSRAALEIAARQQAVRNVTLEILPLEGSVTVEGDAVDAIRATVADHYNRNKTVTSMEGKVVADYSPVANYDALRLLPSVMSADLAPRTGAAQVRRHAEAVFLSGVSDLRQRIGAGVPSRAGGDGACRVSPRAAARTARRGERQAAADADGGRGHHGPRPARSAHPQPASAAARRRYVRSGRIEQSEVSPRVRASGDGRDHRTGAAGRRRAVVSPRAAREPAVARRHGPLAERHRRRLPVPAVRDRHHHLVAGTRTMGARGEGRSARELEARQLRSAQRDGLLAADSDRGAVDHRLLLHVAAPVSRGRRVDASGDRGATAEIRSETEGQDAAAVDRRSGRAGARGRTGIVARARWRADGARTGLHGVPEA